MIAPKPTVAAAVAASVGDLDTAKQEQQQQQRSRWGQPGAKKPVIAVERPKWGAAGRGEGGGAAAAGDGAGANALSQMALEQTASQMEGTRRYASVRLFCYSSTCTFTLNRIHVICTWCVILCVCVDCSYARQ